MPPRDPLVEVHALPTLLCPEHAVRPESQGPPAVRPKEKPPDISPVPALCPGHARGVPQPPKSTTLSRPSPHSQSHGCFSVSGPPRRPGDGQTPADPAPIDSSPESVCRVQMARQGLMSQHSLQPATANEPAVATGRGSRGGRARPSLGVLRAEPPSPRAATQQTQIPPCSFLPRGPLNCPVSSLEDRPFLHADYFCLLTARLRLEGQSDHLGQRVVWSP